MAQMKEANEAHIAGRLGKDAETKYTPSGKYITKFSVATGGGKKKDGSGNSPTEWHNIECWNSEYAVSLKKGGYVDLWGRLHTNTWEKDGKKNYMTVVVATKFVDAPLTPARPKSDDFITDEDIPF
jgi:single-strand DNA-binding protein